MNAGERLFGTDGIRDRAGVGLLEDRQVERIVQATASTLARALADPSVFAVDFDGLGSVTPTPRIVIGRDTRRSGEGLSEAIARTFLDSGFDVADLGVAPTPAVAYLTSVTPRGVLGIVVSASHNPAEYNGIKFLAPTGAKISDDFESAVSDAYWRREERRGARRGTSESAHELLDDYVAYLVAASHHPDLLRGRRIVLDTAHGATFEVAPRVFRALGADVVGIGGRPNGDNINDGCGTLHPDALGRRVVEERALIGFAFDGDGDRMIPVTETGRVLDGDHVLASTGRYLDSRGELGTKTIVATVMSNLGLEKAAAAGGLTLLRTAVGDRHVYEEMVRSGHVLGGEQSGHIIFLNDSRTGDGVLAALRLLDSLELTNWSLDEAAVAVKRYPQILLNYRVSRKVPLESLPSVQDAVARAESSLAGDGRIVLRYSGTEPLARVMIEGPDDALIKTLATEIGEAIVASIAAAEPPPEPEG